jgi:hypothetical protein
MHTFTPCELWIRNNHGKKRHFWNTKCVRLGNILLLLMVENVQFFTVTDNTILCIVTTPRGPVQLPLTPKGSMSL